MKIESKDQETIDRIVKSSRIEHKLLYPCALKPNGDIVYWNQVGQGEYYCTEAKCVDDEGNRRRLRYIPSKDPSKRKSYFKHHRGETGCTETVVHYEATEIIRQTTEISTPPMDYKPKNDFYTFGDFDLVKCLQAEEEKYEGLIPDGAIIINGQLTLIEITVTHNTDAEKIRTLARCGLPVLEIRVNVDTAIKNYEYDDINPGSFEKYILHKARRRWLFHPRIDCKRELDLSNEDWAIAFAGQYKRRLNGQIQPEKHQIDKVIKIMEALPGIVSFFDETIKSGWFTTESAVWQAEVIQYELLESIKTQDYQIHSVAPSGEESYHSLDARARSMAYRLRDVENETKIDLTDLREDMVKPCKSILQRMGIPFKENSLRSILVKSSDLSPLTMTYRILKSVRSIASDGMYDRKNPDKIILVWAIKRQINDMTHTQKINELQKIDSMAHDLRTGNWDGETNPCDLDERLLDRYIMRVKDSLITAKTKNETAKSKADEKWEKAKRDFEEISLKSASKSISIQNSLYKSSSCDIIHQYNYTSNNEKLEFNGAVKSEINEIEESMFFPEFDCELADKIYSESKLPSLSAKSKAVLQAHSERIPEKFRISYRSDVLLSLGGMSRLAYTVDRETLEKAINAR